MSYQKDPGVFSVVPSQIEEMNGNMVCEIPILEICICVFWERQSRKRWFTVNDQGNKLKYKSSYENENRSVIFKIEIGTPKIIIR